MTRSLTTTLAWGGDGAAHLRGLMARMGDDAFAAPSALPGWSRAHVLSHVARQADGMINLLAWARTGVRTPAYASIEQRDADIDAGSTRPPTEIRADVVESSDRLAQVVRDMPPQAWAAQVSNPQGVAFPAIDIPWLRAREMWIHAIDLDVGATFADLPTPMLTELLAEVAAVVGAKPGCPSLRLEAATGTWTLGGSDSPAIVTGTAPELAAWLLGRSRGRELRSSAGRKLPTVPRWL